MCWTQPFTKGHDIVSSTSLPPHAGPAHNWRSSKWLDAVISHFCHQSLTWSFTLVHERERLCQPLGFGSRPFPSSQPPSSGTPCPLTQPFSSTVSGHRLP